jgi:hypothetical protein
LFEEIIQACSRENDQVLTTAASHLIETRSVLTAPKQWFDAVALAKQTTRVAGTIGAQVAAPTDPEIAKRWDDFRAVLNRELGSAVVAEWFEPATLDRLSNGVVTVAVKSRFNASWINRQFLGAINTAAREVFGKTDIGQWIQAQAEARPAPPNGART